jgi:hypothetical protein
VTPWLDTPLLLLSFSPGFYFPIPVLTLTVVVLCPTNIKILTSSIRIEDRRKIEEKQY